MICHSTGDGAYEDEMVSDKIAAQEHGQHPRDIIPAFYYAMPSGTRYFEGQNLTDGGAEILDNACTKPNPDDHAMPGQPHLKLVKSAQDVNGGKVAPGDTLRFSIVVTNDGSASAEHAIVTDAVPAGTTFVRGSATVAAGTVRVADGYVIAHVGAGASATQGGTLAPGESATISFDVHVDELLMIGTVVMNVAQASSVASEGSVPTTESSNEVDVPVDVLPPMPVDIHVDPPTTPTPGSDVPTVVEVAPWVDLVDPTVCITVEMTMPGGMGTASTKCSALQTVQRGHTTKAHIRVRVPRRAAGRCVTLVTDVAAAGHAARERSTRVCIARSRPEAVTG
jgi:uncharacterized repeat protein (TIGR01451 family)